MPDAKSNTSKIDSPTENVPPSTKKTRKRRRTSYSNMLASALKSSADSCDAVPVPVEPTGVFKKIDKI